MASGLQATLSLTHLDPIKKETMQKAHIPHAYIPEIVN